MSKLKGKIHVHAWGNTKKPGHRSIDIKVIWAQQRSTPYKELPAAKLHFYTTSSTRT